MGYYSYLYVNQLINRVMEQAKLWWESLGDNFLMRIIVQGELCTKYYTWMRRPSSLKDKEILHIYEQECFVD